MTEKSIVGIDEYSAPILLRSSSQKECSVKKHHKQKLFGQRALKYTHEGIYPGGKLIKHIALSYLNPDKSGQAIMLKHYETFYLIIYIICK